MQQPNRRQSGIFFLDSRDRGPEGGVGRSAFARMMAREFTVGGMRTKIADLDTQQQTYTN